MAQQTTADEFAQEGKGGTAPTLRRNKHTAGRRCAYFGLMAAVAVAVPDATLNGLPRFRLSAPILRQLSFAPIANITLSIVRILKTIHVVRFSHPNWNLR